MDREQSPRAANVTDALVKLDQLIEAMGKNSYQTSYESALLDKARAIRDDLAPPHNVRVVLAFSVDEAALRCDYERCIGNPSGLSTKQMVTEILSYAYTQLTFRSATVENLDEQD